MIAEVKHEDWVGAGVRAAQRSAAIMWISAKEKVEN